QVRQGVRPLDHAAGLQRGRVEVKQGQGLTHQHLGHGQMAAAELVAGGQQVEIAVCGVDQLTAITAVKGLQQGLGVDQERVPKVVLAIDVPAAAKRQVNVGKELVADDVAECQVTSVSHGRRL